MAEAHEYRCFLSVSRVQPGSSVYQYTAFAREFPSLSWVADSAKDAMTNFRRLLEETLEDMRAAGDTPPAPIPETEEDRRRREEALRVAELPIDFADGTWAVVSNHDL